MGNICMFLRILLLIFLTSTPIYSKTIVVNTYSDLSKALSGHGLNVTIEVAKNIAVLKTLSIVSSTVVMFGINLPTLSSSSPIFNITSSSVTFKTLVLSGRSSVRSSQYGGAFFASNSIISTVSTYFNGSVAMCGSAIFAENSDVTLTSSTFSNNSYSTHTQTSSLSSTCGGAVYVIGGNLKISYSSFKSNVGACGGAIYASSVNSVDIEFSSFSSNVASIYDGGALYMDSGLLKIAESTLFGNKGAHGGALYLSDLVNVTWSDVIFSDNAAYSLGGAVFVQNTIITSSNVEFNSNSATEDGGALHSSLVTAYFEGGSAFSNYAGNAGGWGYVSTNSTFVFLAFDFEDNSALFYGGIINILSGSVLKITKSTMLSNNSPGTSALAPSYGGIIACDHSSMSIENAFVNGSHASYGTNIYLSTCSLYVSDSSFEHSKGANYGIAAMVRSKLVVNATQFISNIALVDGSVAGCISSLICVFIDCLFYRTIGYGTGAITVSQGKSQIINCTFHQNLASTAGGALSLDTRSETTCVGCVFYQNHAFYSGGAISLLSSSSFRCFRCKFHNCIASDGGAIYSEGSWLFLQETILENNYALEQGGAISAGSVTVLRINNSMFINCSSVYGGAIEANYRVTFEAIGSDFIDNYVPYTGGALALFSTVISTLVNCNFVRNQAVLGGVAILEYKNNATFSNCTFSNNSAIDSGGVFYGQVRVGIFVSNSYFSDNFAGYQGGMIYLISSSMSAIDSIITRNTAPEGGVISSFSSSVTLSKCNVSYNGLLSGLFGGVATINQNSELYTSYSFFTNNAAAQGGVIVSIGSDWVSKGDSFCNNFAFQAGVFYGTVGSSLVTTSSIYKSNIAINGYGSVLNMQIGYLTVKNSSFVANICKGSTLTGSGTVVLLGVIATFYKANFVENIIFSGGGGGIYFYDAYVPGSVSKVVDNVIINSCNFIGNVVGSTGGAIYGYYYATNVSIVSSIFERNSAGSYGGALYSDGTMFSISSSSFVNNSAKTGGGAIYWVKSSNISLVNLYGNKNYNFNNKAPYGSFEATNVVHLKSQISSSKFWSGETSSAVIKIYLVDYYNQTVNETYSSGDAPLMYAFPTNQTVTVRGNTVVECQRGVAKFSNLVVTGSAGSNISLQFSISGSTVPPAVVGIELESCVPGQIIQHIAIGETQCYQCTYGTFSLSTSDKSCTLCPPNSNCPGGNTIDVNSGYWRVSETLPDVLQCPIASSCLGGADPNNQCSTGHTGPYCDVCMSGYSRTATGGCIFCNTSTKYMTLILVPLIFVVIITLLILGCVFRRVVFDTFATIMAFFKSLDDAKYRSMRVKLKILLAFYQILTQTGPSLGIIFPANFTNFLSIFSFCSFNLFAIINIQCIYPTDFYFSVITTTLFPFILMFLIIAGLSARVVIAHRMNESHPSYTYPQAKKDIIGLALVISYIALSPVSTQIFEVFGCDTFPNGESYLVADYSINCNTFYHRLMMIYGGVMMCIYPIGIPTVYAYLLISNHSKVNPSSKLVVEKREKKYIREKILQKEKIKVRRTYKEIENISFLYENYKPKRWYFEIFDCFRRLSLGAIPLLILRGSVLQIVIVLLISLASIAAYMSTDPYIANSDNQLAVIAQWSITLTLIAAIVIRVNASSQNSNSVLLGVILIVINVGVIALAIATVVVSTKSSSVNSLSGLPGQDDGDDDDDDDDEEEDDDLDKKNRNSEDEGGHDDRGSQRNSTEKNDIFVGDEDNGQESKYGDDYCEDENNYSKQRGSDLPSNHHGDGVEMSINPLHKVDILGRRSIFDDDEKDSDDEVD